MTPLSELVRSQAQQDQEIAEGVDWLRRSKPESVIRFFNSLNDAETVDDLRVMPDPYLATIGTLAMIGLFEVVHADARRRHAEANQD